MAECQGVCAEAWSLVTGVMHSSQDSVTSPWEVQLLPPLAGEAGNTDVGRPQSAGQGASWMWSDGSTDALPL